MQQQERHKALHDSAEGIRQFDCVHLACMKIAFEKLLQRSMSLLQFCKSLAVAGVLGATVLEDKRTQKTNHQSVQRTPA